MHTRGKTRRVPGRILVGLAAVVVLLAGAVVVHAGQGDDLRDRADELEGGLSDIAASEDAVVLELFALQSDFDRASQRVEQLDARAVRVGEATELAREQTQIARRAVETAQANLAERIRTLYVTDDIDSLDVFIGAQTIQDAVDGIGAIERAATHDQRLLEQVGVARLAAIEQRDELRRRQSEVEQLAADARTARRSLAESRAGRAAFLRSLRRDLELGRRDVAALRRRAVELEARAAELAAEARLAREVEPPAAASSTASEPIPAADPPPAPGAAAPSSPPPASNPSPASPPPAPPPLPPGGPGAGSQMTVVATAYALQGTTAVGVQTQPGIVAVDPNVIPLGAKMSIPGYGDGVAADTGSAVKGAIIDVWFPTVEEALAWGRRTVT
ncbi:MAG: 3D domain-containing protein, partial [Gaiellaceae bacterium]